MSETCVEKIKQGAGIYRPVTCSDPGMSISPQKVCVVGNRGECWAPILTANVPPWLGPHFQGPAMASREHLSPVLFHPPQHLSSGDPQRPASEVPLTAPSSLLHKGGGNIWCQPHSSSSTCFHFPWESANRRSSGTETKKTEEIFNALAGDCAVRL